MKLGPTEPEVVRQYLLGSASAVDSTRVEERLLAEPAFYEELLIAEDELVEEYLAESLSAAERNSFESHFLAATEHQERLAFARVLHKYVDLAAVQESTAVTNHFLSRAAQVPKRKQWLWFLPANPIVAYSLGVAALLLVVSVSWLAFKNRQGPQQPGNVYAATLTPGLTRDGGQLARIPITSATDRIQLKLLVNSEFQTYSAEVFASGGASVLLVDNLAKQNQGSETFVSLIVPASIFGRDDYRIELKGRHADGPYEETARYQFRVIQ